MEENTKMSIRIIGGKKRGGHHREMYVDAYSDNELLDLWNEYYRNRNRIKEIRETVEILSPEGVKEYKWLRSRNEEINTILLKYNIKV